MALSCARSDSLYSRICMNRLCNESRQATRAADYNVEDFVMRAPELAPKPLPPRRRPLGKAPLPFEGCGVGPLAPPPTTAVAGEPNVRGADAVEPMYWLKPRQ